MLWELFRDGVCALLLGICLYVSALLIAHRRGEKGGDDWLRAAIEVGIGGVGVVAMFFGFALCVLAAAAALNS